jgi:16S rRNA (guanine527-N7)-methyltransferase
MTLHAPTPSLAGRLKAGAQALGLALDDHQQARLLAYLDLIQKWNRVYNLTAIRDPQEMLTQHLLDSLAVVPALLRRFPDGDCTLMDVGSGAGLPGVVIAIALPRARVTCVDTVAKKASFIRQVGAELRLPGLTSTHARVEALPPAGCDLVTSRAFASLNDFVTLTRHHLGPQGLWLAMKGKTPVDEIAGLPADVEVFHVEQLTVPDLDAERCLVWMRPTPTA